MDTETIESNRSNNNISIQPNILSTTNGETAFFCSIIRYRPRGYNRHFSMLGICKDLEKELQVVIPSNQIWNTLRSCYNLSVLAEMEPDDPDEIDRSKSTIEILNSKKAFFQEFQLPIHHTTPPEYSFLDLVNERRLETSYNPSSPDQANVPIVHSPRSRRTTVNSSSKLHQDQRHNTTNKNQNKHHPVDVSKSTTDHRLGEEGMESDLTEQEDYEDEDDDNEDNQKDKDDEKEEESTPEPKTKKLKTSKQQYESNSTAHSNRSRANNSNNLNNSSSSNNKQSANNNNSLARSNRSRNRSRWKK